MGEGKAAGADVTTTAPWPSLACVVLMEVMLLGPWRPGVSAPRAPLREAATIPRNYANRCGREPASLPRRRARAPAGIGKTGKPLAPTRLSGALVRVRRSEGLRTLLHCGS